MPIEIRRMPHTRNLTVTLSIDAFLALSQLADVSGVKPTAFLRALVDHAAEAQLIVRERLEDKLAWLDAIATGQPAPKVRLEVAPVEPPLSLVEAPSASRAQLA